MGSYVPNTLEERQEMLKEIGYSSIEDLFNSDMRTNMFFHVFGDQTVDFNVIFGFC